MPWLMKAEPDSRIVKGKDVKFSVDDFEKIGISQWDGVRNHEAKNIMKDQMKLGDKILFYHSNCKEPGVYAIAEIAKEGYPDYTAFAPDHPYYDPKSTESNPTWYMVSIRFIARLPNPVTLAEIKNLIGHSTPPKNVAYIGKEGLAAIKSMPLVNRSRLSVQPVTQQAYDAIVAMGFKGGLNGTIIQGSSRDMIHSKPASVNVIIPSSGAPIPTPTITTASTTDAAGVIRTGKRGRPKKIVTEDKITVGSKSTSSSSTTKRPATTVVGDESGAKKGRGRPKKILTPAEEAAKAKKEAEKLANPRPRGRPKKIEA